MFDVSLNLVGHPEAGKTSLATRLMGKQFKEDVQSTEGIAIHHIKSYLERNMLESTNWEEIAISKMGLMMDFSQAVLAAAEEEVKSDSNEKDTESSEVTGEAIPKRKSEVKRLKRTPEEEPLLAPTKEITGTNSSSKTANANGNGHTLVMSDQLRREIIDVQKSFPSGEADERIPFSLALWDFAGRNEFTATHHLFLNTETTTLVVMDITRDLHTPLDQDPKVDYPNTPAEVLRYWINALAVEAAEKNTEPNMALVLTHTDSIESNDPQKYKEAYIAEILEMIKDYPIQLTRQSIYVVDSKTGQDSEFQLLRNKLLKYFSKQDTWGKMIPLQWLKMRADIIKKNETGNKYLTLQEVRVLAQQYGVDNQAVETFLQRENTLGHAIYFPDSKTVITDPMASQQFKSPDYNT